MPKVDYKKLINSLGEDRIREVFAEHSLKESAKILDIGKVKFEKIVEYLGLEHDCNAVRKSTIAKDPNYYENRNNKIRATKLEKYGDENYCNIEQGIKTRYQNYESKEEYNKHYTEVYMRNLAEKFGSWEEYCKYHAEKVTEAAQNRSEEERMAIGAKVSTAIKAVMATKKDEIVSARKNTLIEKYGSWEDYISQMTDKVSKTCQEKFGVDWACLRQEASLSGNDSSNNRDFKEILQKYGLYKSDEENKEFPIGKFRYDFKVDNSLIEIDPYHTHNSTYGIYNDPPKPPTYHQDKTKVAQENGFECIHIFDWDNVDITLKRFFRAKIIQARKCSLEVISSKIASNFLDTQHAQGKCRGQSVCLGLFYEDELIQVMTFGKPRYNKNYEYELLRLCSKSGYRVIGGSEKLFKYFIRNYSPKSIISYCDNAKYSGGVYSRLGFKLVDYGKPGKHWYNPKTKVHITDNLLRQRGFDQLLGKTYGTFGKGTSNDELMLSHGFVEIYDCGQSVYVYENCI